MIETAVCFIDEEHAPFYCGIETVKASDEVEQEKWHEKIQEQVKEIQLISDLKQQIKDQAKRISS